MKGEYDKDIKMLSEQIVELWNLNCKLSEREDNVELRLKEAHMRLNKLETRMKRLEKCQKSR